MIRINLLPAARKQSPAFAGVDTDAQWFVMYAVAALVTMVACGLAYWNASASLTELRARNGALLQRIETMNREAADIEALRTELERSEALDQVVAELQRARYGPTEILMELARVLSVSGGPTVDEARLAELRRSNPLAGFNATWDPRRVWLTEIREEDARQLRLTGAAKTNEDVAEFLRRLVLSESFEDVRLQRTMATTESFSDGIIRAEDVEVIEFTITARVRY